jgi:hypothetical protein
MVLGLCCNMDTSRGKRVAPVVGGSFREDGLHLSELPPLIESLA